MTQNIFDDERFFSAYSQLRELDSGLNGAIEMPALQALLPPLAGLRILDLGCGFGDFARLARAQGAQSVVAVDISERMLVKARSLTDDPGIDYRRDSIESYRPPPSSFDLVVSSLSLHYVADYTGAVGRIHSALVPGGRFVFSVEHPICTAYPAGWIRDGEGRARYWPLDCYSDESVRSTHWFVDGVIKYHRTTATYVNTLLSAGFRLLHLGEPTAVASALATRPGLEIHSRRPPFLVLAAAKSG